MLDPEPAAHQTQVLARGLTRSYGPLRALAGIDLEIQKGDFLTIFGPNGAGKTTLLKVLACLIRPSDGSLSIFGLDPRENADLVKRRLGLTAHAGLLYGGLTARDNLHFYARMYDLVDARERAGEMLEQVGLQDRADSLVRTLSRGMQQRLSIARALIHDPEMVLLDEPYTGLDQHASRMLRRMLDQVRGQGRTVVMVTHRLEEGLEVSTRIAIMTRGRLACDAPASSLSRDALERLYLKVAGGSAS